MLANKVRSGMIQTLPRVHLAKVIAHMIQFAKPLPYGRRAQDLLESYVHKIAQSLGATCVC
jgi:hypothetical protein